MDVREPARVTGRRTVWLAFAAFGALDAVVLLELPTAGLLLVLLALVGIAARPPRLPAVAGLISGIGGVWTLLIGRVWLTCTGFDPATGETCEAPGIEGWLLLGLGILAVGVLGSIAVLAGRRSSAEPEQGA